MSLEVWCDGSSGGRSNAPGGWAFILIRDGSVVFANYGGGEKETNNTMELQAAIQGLTAAQQYATSSEEIVLISDSMYCLNSANGTNTPVKNVQLVKQLREIYLRVSAITKWCKGHSLIPANERCDSLARRGRDEIRRLVDGNENAS